MLDFFKSKLDLKLFTVAAFYRLAVGDLETMSVSSSDSVS